MEGLVVEGNQEASRLLDGSRENGARGRDFSSHLAIDIVDCGSDCDHRLDRLFGIRAFQVRCTSILNIFQGVYDFGNPDLKEFPQSPTVLVMCGDVVRVPERYF
jgi:hypothetical protein